ncbi:MAG TPA: hypothetical protein VGK90_10395 [Rhizomicrobium sp.]|jgi:hypothetical protein
MGTLFEILLGAPLSAESRTRALQTMIGDRPAREAAEMLRWGAAHNTEKSGALLAALAIFVVVDTFLLEHGWTRTPTLISLFLLLAATLVLITNLRSTMRAWQQRDTAATHIHIWDMIVSRTIRFNIALYSTFLAIIMLAFAAAENVF